MFCKNCGSEIPKYGVYCEKCGALTDEVVSAAAKSEKNKKRNIIIAIIGAVVLIIILLIPKGGIIDESLKEQARNAPYEGKGTSDIGDIVEAYLLSLKNANMEPLEKYLDNNTNYSNFERGIDDIASATGGLNIDISTAEYSITKEYTVNGKDCVEIEVHVYGEGVKKHIDEITCQIGAHKAGERNLWFFG